jgi:AcrR family transcriptional regulator
MRLQIFDAASKLFLEQGYHETSMRQIAEAAGMGKSTLYDYFPNKAEILLFFTDQELGMTYETAAQIAEQEMPVSEKLRAIMRSLWTYLDQNRAMAALLTREVSRLDEGATQRLIQQRLKFRRILEHVIREGIRYGAFRLVNPKLAASALHSLMTMPFYNWMRSGEEADIAAKLDELLDLYLHGLQTR